MPDTSPTKGETRIEKAVRLLIITSVAAGTALLLSSYTRGYTLGPEHCAGAPARFASSPQTLIIIIREIETYHALRWLPEARSGCCHRG